MGPDASAHLRSQRPAPEAAPSRRAYRVQSMSAAMDKNPGGRVLVFINAHQAEKEIVSTFDRIPKELLCSDDVQILCIDDGSSDRTAALAADWVKQHAYENVTILRNPVNLGYGGNQKLGYRLALEWGFYLVIRARSDGRYAPELLPQLIDAFKASDCDVVI